MATNYQGALEQLLKFDTGRTAYFDVTINTPTELVKLGLVPATTKSLEFLCHSAELPGESVATVSQKIYGVVQKYPIMSVYSDIVLSFYIPGSGTENVRKTFLSWIAATTGRGESVGNGLPTTYNVKYKRDITSDIYITHYTSTGDILLSCKLVDAFPIAISQIPLSWSAENQAISFNVTFTYTEYEYNFKTAQPPQIQSGILNGNVTPLNQAFLNSITPNLQSLNKG